MSFPIIGGPERLLFRLNGQTYAVPLSSVERVIQAVAVTPVPEMPGFVLGLINIAGELVPVCSLRACLGLADRPVGIEDQMLIVRTASLRIAVVVDAAEGLRKAAADISALSVDMMPAAGCRAEGVVRIDGDIILIYDLDQVLQPRDRQQLQQVIARGQESGVLS